MKARRPDWGEQSPKQKPPLWRLLKFWHPYEWVPIKEAWQRVQASVGGVLWLTQRDLRQAFLDKQLIGAARRFAPDGTETRIILEPTFWQRLKIKDASSITGWETEARKGEKWVFVVHRRELDRLYPVTAASEQPTTAAQLAHDDVQERRKRGPKDKTGWRLIYAGEAYLFKQRMGRLPSAIELAKNCADKSKHQPEPRTIQRLLSYLAGE